MLSFLPPEITAGGNTILPCSSNCTHYQYFVLVSREQDAKVAHICSGWAGRDYISQRYKERIRIAAPKRVFDVEPNCCGAFNGRAINDCTRSGTVAIYAVCSRAECDRAERDRSAETE